MGNWINEPTSIVLVAAFTFLTALVSKTKPKGEDDKDNKTDDKLTNQMFAQISKQMEQQSEKIKSLEGIQAEYDDFKDKYQYLLDDYKYLKKENDRLRERVSTLEGKQ